MIICFRKQQRGPKEKDAVAELTKLASTKRIRTGDFSKKFTGPKKR